MKFSKKKGFCEKLIISIICILLLNFCFTPFTGKVSAQTESTFGGKMMGIVRDFVTGIADAAASLVQLGVTGEWLNAVDEPGSGTPDTSAPKGEYWIKKDKFRYPILQISPELIFANQIELLDVNFVAPINNKDYALNLKDDSPLEMLRGIVSGWYVTLRTIAVVGLLSVLIYIGIRIIISSTASDRAKYKQRLMDWIVAFCLLFFMHYIMAALVTVVEKVDEMLGQTVDVTQGLELMPDYGGVTYAGLKTNSGGNVNLGGNNTSFGTTRAEVEQAAISKMRFRANNKRNMANS